MSKFYFSNCLTSFFITVYVRHIGISRYSFEMERCIFDKFLAIECEYFVICTWINVSSNLLSDSPSRVQLSWQHPYWGRVRREASRALVGVMSFCSEIYGQELGFFEYPEQHRMCWPTGQILPHSTLADLQTRKKKDVFVKHLSTHPSQITTKWNQVKCQC